MSSPREKARGPFKAEQIRSGDHYELSNGHSIHCMTTGSRGSRANLLGGSVLDTDPAVEEAGIDTGYAPSEGTLRAPDVAVGNVPNEPGWVAGAPPLAVEYADSGQDEKDLKVKIAELLEAGTRLIWVVRLTGPRRVEIHEAGKEKRTALAGEELEAPGILQNKVPVEALYDREAAHRVTFRNLLQRQGYQNLDEVRNEGRAEGRNEGRAEGRNEGRNEGGLLALRQALLGILSSRGLDLSPEDHEKLAKCHDMAILQSWLIRAASRSSTQEIFGIS